uniref:Uncharacterized protein n=1 Tax=Tetraselmis sp. GSL018 TaxID=582737 RepID=A0A061S293_9CHLO
MFYPPRQWCSQHSAQARALAVLSAAATQPAGMLAISAMRAALGTAGSAPNDRICSSRESTCSQSLRITPLIAADTISSCPSSTLGGSSMPVMTCSGSDACADPTSFTELMLSEVLRRGLFSTPRIALSHPDGHRPKSS